MKKTGALAVALLLILVLTGAAVSGCSASPKTAGNTGFQPSGTDAVRDGLAATPEPTEEPTPTPEPTPEPTAIPEAFFLGAWKSCGVTTEDGTYRPVGQMEDAGDYSGTDFYCILNETDADLYLQGEKRYGVAWVTTETGIVVGDDVMTLEEGRLYCRCGSGLLWYERIVGVNSVDEIEWNPYLEATAGQILAMKKAEAHLSEAGFSYKGLIKQLEHDGIAHEDAVYAADNCGADWVEQAAKLAEFYLSGTGISYKGLVKQLKRDGFSAEDAAYAADNCGADWYEQAVKAAQTYSVYSSFTKKGLIKQLEYEGFTHKQAVYGVDRAGY